MLFWGLKCRVEQDGDPMNGYLFGATRGGDLRSGVAERSCGVELQAISLYELHQLVRYKPQRPPSLAPYRSSIFIQAV